MSRGTSLGWRVGQMIRAKKDESVTIAGDAGYADVYCASPSFYKKEFYVKC